MCHEQWIAMASSCFAPRDVLRLLKLHYQPLVACSTTKKVYQSIAYVASCLYFIEVDFLMLLHPKICQKVVGKSLVVRRVVFWSEMDKAPLRNSASEWMCFCCCAVFWGTGFPGTFGIGPFLIMQNVQIWNQSTAYYEESGSSSSAVCPQTSWFSK